MGIKVTQDASKRTLIKERIGDEVTLAYKPDEEQSGDQSDYLLLDLLAIILWDIGIIGIGNTSLFIYSPEEPLEELVIEVLSQSLYRESFANSSERNPRLLQLEEAPYWRIESPLSRAKEIGISLRVCLLSLDITDEG